MKKTSSNYSSEKYVLESKWARAVTVSTQARVRGQGGEVHFEA